MSAMKKPLVSIIIPVFNREEVLAETLDSVLVQSYIHWECIVVDDGSTDNSSLIIGEYCKKDPRFKFFNRPEINIKGASACRNYGFQQSQGQFIQYLDSDDILDSDKLLAQSKMFSVDENFTLFTCKWGWFSDSSALSTRFKHSYNAYKNFRNPSQLLKTFGYYDEYLPLHNYLTPRDLIIKSGEWNEQLSNNDDAEFFTRVILNSEKILFAETAIVYYRFTGNDNLSKLDSKEKAVSAINSWEMIDSYLSANSKKPPKEYIQNALFNLYIVLDKNFPDLLSNHKLLFDKRKKFDSTYFKIVKKIKSN